MRNPAVCISCLVLLFSCSALAQKLELKDPKGDDRGPGNYSYPTGADYKAGSFDMTGVTLEDKGDTLEVQVQFAAKITDPWGSKKWGGNGFSLQMVFLYFDQDHKAGSGQKAALPGLNVQFTEDSRWEKAAIISPQGTKRLKNELRKARKLKGDVVLPIKVKARGRTLVATFNKAELGGFDPKWGIQALVQSNEGFPRANDILTRPVNEYKGEHRFGGGSDYDCDPHVIDMLAGSARGGEDEKAAQFKALSGFKCTDDPDTGKQTEIPMVYAQ